MGRVIRRVRPGEIETMDAQSDVIEIDEDQFVNASVSVPADGLASFYRAVAEWWERYEDDARGRVIR
ncbi:MAG TPA: hypothetical protein VM324_15420 [Egibacteraceae bacterium]|jgi:hypothetical protein|nr:hypothetical protein [Egibacteraceae bacterium]